MTNYKLKELSIFGSTETLYYNQKKYRRVFDEAEACYVYCEISLYNKLFDESNWEAQVNLKCYNEQTGEIHCDLNKSIPVDMNQNLVYIREGWGTPHSGWWKKGKYRWTITIDGVHVGDTYFYIVDGGSVSSEYNPYFEIESIKLYESQRAGMPIAERSYLKSFSVQETRYVNIELTLLNSRPDDPLYPIEMHFNFFNQAGHHKAYVHYLYEFTDKPAKITFDSGYGAESKDYWFEDLYKIEIVFMDTLIAVVPFEITQEFVLSDGGLPYSTQQGIPTWVDGQQVNDVQPALTFEEAKAELDTLIGLNPVKEQINEFATYLQFLQLRKENGFEEKSQISLNSVFIGNPGTGKTTVARLLGKIYASLGLLSNGNVHEVGRVDLVGEYIGQTAPKVKKAIENAKGGILFIDEAYSLSDRGDDSKDFGREVIEVLIKEMSDGKGDLAVVFAGYPKEMKQFLNINPGLSSRLSNVIHFPDYSPDELMKIAEFTAEHRHVHLNAESWEYIHRKVVEAYRNRGDNFGNARFVNTVIEGAKLNLALRFMKAHHEATATNADQTYTPEQLSTVEINDLEKVFYKDKFKSVSLPIDEPMLKDAIAQLNEMTGLRKVKTEIDETIKLVRYYREVGKDIHKGFSLHTVFTGNPGTGKTTVSRILAQIYKALGILERGHLVETDRKDLVAEFVGQTAAKTDAVIESAYGGCLFIDEAYALTSQGGNDFGREAIETLLKRMEDQRGRFMVIVAGYTEEMKRFLEANPGLMSRFDKQVQFEDYSEAELLQISELMFEKEDLKLDTDAKTFLNDSIKKLLANSHKYFGNARTVRKLVEETVRQQNLRMAEMSPSARTTTMIHTVITDDLKGISLFEGDQNTGRIGFRAG